MKNKIDELEKLALEREAEVQRLKVERETVQNNMARFQEESDKEIEMLLWVFAFLTSLFWISAAFDWHSISMNIQQETVQRNACWNDEEEIRTSRTFGRWQWWISSMQQQLTTHSILRNRQQQLLFHFLFIFRFYFIVTSLNCQTLLNCKQKNLSKLHAIYLQNTQICLSIGTIYFFSTQFQLKGKLIKIVGRRVRISCTD